VWDAASGEQLATIDEDQLLAAALDEDGSRAVVVSASGAQVLDVDTGDVLATFAEDSDVARDSYDAALDDAGERALVWGQSGALLFDLDSGQEVAELGRTDRAAFDHGGSRFATVSGGEISIRDADGQLLVAIPKDGVNSQPAFSHDDALLYIGVGDGVELYDVESGLLLGTVPTGQVTDAVPDETGERLTVAAADATLHVWRSWAVDAMREELVARLDGRELSETECDLYDVPGC
jgi:hypothetical protein